MKPLVRVPRRKIVPRRIKPPLAYPVFKPRIKPKPIKVVFYCMGGQHSSHAGKIGFEKILKQKNLAGKFVVDYEGYMQQSPQHIRSALEEADFVIPMFPAIRIKLLELMKKSRKKPVLVDVGFKTIEDEYKPEMYEKVLRKITRTGLPHEKRKKVVLKKKS